MEVLKRFYKLIIKLVSVKGLVFFIATGFLLFGKITDTTWWLTALVIIGGRAFEKIGYNK